MDDITDAPMRDFLGRSGAFTYAVSEFMRVSIDVLPAKAFLREIPELATGSLTTSGMPVQVQILGGDPERVAASAVNAVAAGALAIDINFGCPAPTVNRNDGGASLLRFPCRIRDIVAAVRAALPRETPVSAKLRLGWEAIEDIHENAQMAAEGGASWLTIHARTRVQGYKPPVFWPEIRRVREALSIPVIANGDIWTLDDFRRCRDETGSIHYMIGRGALANPALPGEIARELGEKRLDRRPPGLHLSCTHGAGPGHPSGADAPPPHPSSLRSQTLSPSGEGSPGRDWVQLFSEFIACAQDHYGLDSKRTLFRLKQWGSLAKQFGDFPAFDRVKTSESTEEFIRRLTEP